MTQTDALTILQTGANVFLTGEPGSGKTHTINAYVRWLQSHGIEPAITASTGIAATHIGGMTIHSWSGIGVASSMTPELLDTIASKEHIAKRIQKTSVLIIDEVSMLSADTLTMVDQVVRTVKRTDTLPFGGMQVVVVGDFFQLPPVSRGNVSFAFESLSWRTLNPIVCYLTEQHRQEDGRFLDVLGAIRDGSWDHTHVSLITTRMTDQDGLTDEVPQLFTHNADVDRINNDKLAQLAGTAQTYVMDSTGAAVLIEALKRGCLSPERLLLKEGAVVMCTKNNAAAGYVNGTIGIVTGFERGTGYPIIETHDGATLTIAPSEWVVEENGRVRAKITQIPLRLAWALTIHKSQGQSLDAAAIDLSRAFEYGQGYVALSRVRSLEGLHLLGWSEDALRIHPTVTQIDAQFRGASEAASVAFAELESSGERAQMEENFIKACGGTLVAAPEGKHLKKEKKSTYDETLTLVQQGKTAEDIAKERSLTIGTICDHIEKLADSGRIEPAHLRSLLSPRLTKALPTITATFERLGYEKLTPVFAALKNEYTFDELKLVRVVCQAKA